MFRRRSSSQNYYSNRGNERRSRRALSGKLNAIKNFAIKMFVVFLFGGMLYAILFTPVLAVKNVIIEGNKAISGGEIKEIIISLAERKIFKIFNNNLLLINPSDMESAIIDRFGNIDTVRVEKKFPQTIKVAIKEKPADISWCNKIIIEKITNEKNVSGDEVPASEIPQCYLSDEDGMIYEKIGDNIARDSIKVFRDEPIEIGLKISDENLKNFIRKIFYDFSGKTGLSLDYLYILPPASRELHLATQDDLKIYFDLNRGADEQISDLSAFIKNELKENDNKSIDYDYIDLRIIDRIIVKPKIKIKN
ncbi:FtsQ-type POTRA domain-containing protein [Patescibacteria group bacterium]|nr:FtsQ-type POTRA domain-containing protein [Patescibacteria group bacterium]